MQITIVLTLSDSYILQHFTNYNIYLQSQILALYYANYIIYLHRQILTLYYANYNIYLHRQILRMKTLPPDPHHEFYPKKIK